MSTPNNSTLGFDPILTGWLAQDNASKIPQVTTDAADNAINFVWSAITGSPSPTMKHQTILNNEASVALAGGSPADIAQVANETQAIFDMNAADTANQNPLQWIGLALIVLGIVVAYLLVKEVI